MSLSPEVCGQQGLLTLDAVWESGPSLVTTTIVLGDVDGDGDLDLLCGNNEASQSHKLYENESGEFLETPSWSASVPEEVLAMALGDINGDGWLDLVCGNQRGVPNSLYLNNGGAFANSPVWQSKLENETAAVALGDIDKDGDLDLVCGNDGQSNTVYRNNNGVLEAEPAWVSAEDDSTRGIALGDMNGDGWLDLVCGDKGQANKIYLNTGGSFATVPDWTSNLARHTYSVALGDLNGDGRLDLACGNAETEANTVYLNSEALPGQDPAWEAKLPGSTFSVALGDVDKDGDLDLVCGNNNDYNWCYLNDGGLLRQDPDWTSGSDRPTVSIALGDLDGDGDLDLVCGNYSHANTAYSSLARTFSAAATWSEVLADSTRAVALVDVDVDGDLDLVCGNNKSHRNSLYRNDDGVLTAFPVWISQEAGTTWSVALSDLDGDTDLDLVCGNYGEPLLGRSNTGYRFENGAFTEPPAWTSGPDHRRNTRSVALGDVDGDGLADLVCGNHNFDRNTLFLNDGDFFAQDPVWQADDLHDTAAIALGDVDGDGDLDLVCGNTSGTKNCCFLNHSGMFSSTPDWRSEPGNSTSSIALGDVNGDGRLDLVCGNQNQANTLYLNNGSLFESTSSSWSDAETNTTFSVALADVNGDGALDLICGNTDEGTTLYLNEGGTFPAHPNWTIAPGDDAASLALGDLDGDGDLDLVCGNLEQPNTVYSGIGNPVFAGSLTDPVHQLPNNGAFLRNVDVVWLSDNVYTVSATLYDVESDPVMIVPEYQFVGEPEWFPATLTVPRKRIGPVASSPLGVPFLFEWDVSRVQLERREAILRLRAISNPLRVAMGGHTGTYLKSVGRLDVLRPEISANVAGLDFPTMTVGDRDSQTVVISNTGTVLLQVSKITTPANGLRYHPAAPFDIAPGDSRPLTVYLEPIQPIVTDGNLEIESNDLLTRVLEIPISTDILPLEVDTRLLAPAPEVPLGQALTVIVSPTPPAVHVTEGWLLYRPASAGLAFLDSIQLQPSGEEVLDFIAVIPNADVTEAGLDYYVRVHNNEVSANDPQLAPAEFFSQAVAPPDSFTTFIVPTTGSDHLASRPIRVELDPDEGTWFQSGVLYYRQGGRTDYEAVSFIEEPLGPVTTIPAEAVGPRGVECYIEVTTLTSILKYPPLAQPELDPKVIPVTVTDFQESVSHPGMKYRMISIPLFLGQSNTRTLEEMLSDQESFGPYDPRYWRAYRYVPGLPEGHNVEFSHDDDDGHFLPVPGRGYWLISRNAHRITTAPITGYSTSTADDYEIALEPGYNQIGNPYAFAVLWSRATADGVPVAESDLVESPVAFRNGQYRFGIERLEPFEGYWVRNIHPGQASVVLRIPPLEAPADSMAVELLAGDGPAGKGADEWLVTIQAICEEAADSGNHFGIAAGSSAGWDRLDHSDPPPTPGKSVTLYFPHREWAVRPGPYAVDMRNAVEGMSDRSAEHTGTALGSCGHVWAFDVAKNFADQRAGDEVQIVCADLDLIPPTAEVVLVDRTLGKIEDLRSTGAYRYYLGKRERVPNATDARFRLLVGTPEFIAEHGDEIPPLPARTALHQNYPNPFNPSTMIRFDIAKPGQVSLKIFSLDGALVRVLFSGHCNPGRNEVIWQGDDNRGQAVATGVYFGRLQTDAGFRETRKMLLIK